MEKRDDVIRLSPQERIAQMTELLGPLRVSLYQTRGGQAHSLLQRIVCVNCGHFWDPDHDPDRAQLHRFHVLRTVEVYNWHRIERDPHKPDEQSCVPGCWYCGEAFADHLLHQCADFLIEVQQAVVQCEALAAQRQREFNDDLLRSMGYDPLVNHVTRFIEKTLEHLLRLKALIIPATEGDGWFVYFPLGAMYRTEVMPQGYVMSGRLLWWYDEHIFRYANEMLEYVGKADPWPQPQKFPGEARP